MSNKKVTQKRTFKKVEREFSVGEKVSFKVKSREEVGTITEVGDSKALIHLERNGDSVRVKTSRLTFIKTLWRSEQYKGGELVSFKIDGKENTGVVLGYKNGRVLVEVREIDEDIEIEEKELTFIKRLF